MKKAVCILGLVAMLYSAIARDTFIISAGNGKFIHLKHVPYEIGDTPNVTYGTNTFLIIKHIARRPGRYVIFGDRNYINAYIPMVFDIDSFNQISIVRSASFYGCLIDSSSHIIFENQNR